MAYIDPNTGGMLSQVLAAGFALLSGGVLIFSRQIHAGFARLKHYVRQLLHKDDQGETVFQKYFLRYHLAVLLGFTLLVVLVNWPLVTHIQTHVVGRTVDDAFEVLWQLSWMEKATFKLHTNPFYTPDIFYPQGWYLASGAQPSWYFLLFAPVTHLLGAVVTYNLLMLSTFVLAGFGIYLLAYYFTQRRLPSIIAGCVYISSPVVTAHLIGHTHVLLGIMFLPYVTWGFYHVFYHRKGHWHWIFMTGLMLATTILSQWYFLFIATLPLISFALFVPTTITKREWLKRFMTLVFITFLIILPFACLTWIAREKMFSGRGDFSLATAEVWALSPGYLLIPNSNHPLWGNVFHAYIQGEHNMVFVGYTALILAVYGIVFGKRAYKRPFVIMGMVALVLAMGLFLRWNNVRVTLPAAPFIANSMQHLYPDIPLPSDRIAIPLPGLLLYHLLPFYASMRVWARFMIPFMVAVAVLAGFGANYLLNKKPGWHHGLIILGMLIIFEGLSIPYREFTPVSRNCRSADQWLAEQPVGTTLIEYPRYTFNYVNINAMFSQSRHGQRVVNGYMSTEPSFLQAVTAQLGVWPDSVALPILRDWGVQYILVSGFSQSSEFQNEILSKISRLDGLCYVRTFDDGFMYFDQTHIFKLIPASESYPH